MLDGQEEIGNMVKTIQNRGYYPYVTDADEVAEISNTPGVPGKTNFSRKVVLISCSDKSPSGFHGCHSIGSVGIGVNLLSVSRGNRGTTHKDPYLVS